VLLELAGLVSWAKAGAARAIAAAPAMMKAFMRANPYVVFTATTQRRQQRLRSDRGAAIKEFGGAWITRSPLGLARFDPGLDFDRAPSDAIIGTSSSQVFRRVAKIDNEFPCRLTCRWPPCRGDGYVTTHYFCDVRANGASDVTTAITSCSVLLRPQTPNSSANASTARCWSLGSGGARREVRPPDRRANR
jgi:hypothetical protein